MSKIDIIDKLEKIINEQTKNTLIPVHTDDLEKLGMPSFQVKGTVYIELYKLKMLMERYRENAPKMILDRRNEDAWEK